MAGEAPGVNIAPWLSVGDGSPRLGYYRAALGAVARCLFEDSAGRVIIARLAIDDADFWLQEDPGFTPPQDDGGPIRLILSVADLDVVFAQAVAAGASEVYPVTEDHGWRIGRLADPFGHHWEVGRPLST